MDSAHDWRRYYAAERARLGVGHLHRLLDEAAASPVAVTVPAGGAIVIPHTRLEVTGAQIASAANAVVATGAERILALGVLHGARRCDADSLPAARSGDADAIVALRGIHDEHGLAAEEFSLDAFVEMTALAAARVGRHVEVVQRYPFLVGDDPATLPGLDELRELIDGGAVLVVTTDPIHHGHAYGTPTEDCCDEHDPQTVVTARAAIAEQLQLLSTHRFADFQAMTARHHSDFRDTGPVMAWLLGQGFTAEIHDLALVDYTLALEAPPPSWVAGALMSINRR